MVALASKRSGLGLEEQCPWPRRILFRYDMVAKLDVAA